MSDARLEAALRRAVPPEAQEAERRARAVTLAAFAERVPSRGRRARLRVAAALALVVPAVGAALTPPGQALGGWVRERVVPAREPVPARVLVPAPPARPAVAPFRLPGPGRLLVVARGVWVAGPGTLRRRLGEGEDASWSPRGLHVAVTDRGTLRALSATGDLRWARSHAAPVDRPRWSPDGFRIAYAVHQDLWIVAGDGSDPQRLARGGALSAAAPAWQPRRDGRHVLAHVGVDGRVRVLETDAVPVLPRRVRPRVLATLPRREFPTALAWSSDGRRLAVLAHRTLRTYDAAGRPVGRVLRLPRRSFANEIAYAPSGHVLALNRHDRAAGTSAVTLVRDGRTVRVLLGASTWLEGMVWSPDGRGLLLADSAGGPGRRGQWIVLSPRRGGSFRTLPDLAGVFGTAGAPFRLRGWCCPP